MLRFWMLAGIVPFFAGAAIGAGIDPYCIEVQELLREERVYQGDPNGIADANMIAAIRRYQIIHGLLVTGRLDDPTLSAMQLPPPPPHPEVVAQDRGFLRDLTSWHAPFPVAEASSGKKRHGKTTEAAQPPPDEAARESSPSAGTDEKTVALAGDRDAPLLSVPHQESRKPRRHSRLHDHR